MSGIDFSSLDPGIRAELLAHGVDPTLPTLPRPHAEPTGEGLVVQLEFIAGLTDAKLSSILPFVFQVPPMNIFPINRSYPHNEYDTVAGEQRSRPGSIQLQTYQWDTLFTDQPYTWTLLHGDGFLPDPLSMLARLDEVGNAQTPVLLSARHHYLDAFEVYTAATLRSVNSEEHDGEPDARYVTVAFSEYKGTSINTNRLGGGSRNAHLPLTLVAKNIPVGRETLYALSTYYYGSVSLWRRIAKANGLTIAPSVNLHTLGNRKLTIPRQP